MKFYLDQTDMLIVNAALSLLSALNISEVVINCQYASAFSEISSDYFSTPLEALLERRHYRTVKQPFQVDPYPR